MDKSSFNLFLIFGFHGTNRKCTKMIHVHLRLTSCFTPGLLCVFRYRLHFVTRKPEFCPGPVIFYAHVIHRFIAPVDFLHQENLLVIVGSFDSVPGIL